MPAWGPQPHQIGTLAIGQTGGGGPTLIARRFYDNPGQITDSVPAGAGRMSMRAVGAAAGSAGNVRGGGGAAFARTDRACTPGQTVEVVVGTGGNGSATANATTITVAGTLRCSAAPANGQIGGQASACVGDVAYSGGNGGQNNLGSTAGANGGGADGTTYSGGGAAGERNAFDCLLIGGRGGAAAATNGTTGGRPGGGGGTGANASAGIGADGAAVIEYWSA